MPDDYEEVESERSSLSSGHFSTDTQLEDAVGFLEDSDHDLYVKFLDEFPEWTTRTMGEGISSWFDTDAMGVDIEWSNWCIDWLEANTGIYWEDGEPWVDV